MLEVVEEGTGCALTHMARDRVLLAQGHARPRLSFYDWSSFCVTYGLFSRPEHCLNLDLCKEHGIEVAARPTGGGIFFHERDFPFSLFVPKDYSLREGSFEAFWRCIQECIVNKLQCVFPNVLEVGSSQSISGRFCQAESHGCDFVWEGKKFGGAAFRKSKAGILCQAALLYEPFPLEIAALCVKDQRVFEAMKRVSAPLASLSEPCSKKHLQKVITLAISEHI